MTRLILPSHADHLHFRHRLPDQRLSPWVQCLWSIGSPNHLIEPRTEKLYPDAGASLSIKLARHRPIITLCLNRRTLIETLDATTPSLGIRFKAAGIHGLLAATRPLADIALQCGYFDQAHFTHAFQALAYETPTAYRKRKLSQIYKA